MNLASQHVLNHVRSGSTIQDLIARRHPCLDRLTWRDLEDIEAELEADVERAKE